MKFRTILADPPWDQPMSGKYRGRNSRPKNLSYPTMTIEEICDLGVEEFADQGCHLWLWTTNSFLRAGFEVMERWGFRYLAPIHWLKPSGFGNYVSHRTQTCLLGYKPPCRFPRLRYFDNIFETKRDPSGHSVKPNTLYDLIEAVSDAPRLELFARHRRFEWSAWGNEVYSDIELQMAGRDPLPTSPQQDVTKEK